MKLKLPCLKTMLMIDIAPQSQLSSLASPSTGIHHAGESSTLPHKIGHANETLSTLKDIGPSYTIHRPEHAIQPPFLHSAFPSPPHTMSKRLIKLIVISDFVSPPPAAQANINSLVSCIPAYLFASLPFPGLPVVFCRPSRASGRHRAVLQSSSIF